MAWYQDPVMPSGYWGEVTATLVWCEEKYQWSKYLAEPVNSLTNVFFIALAAYGARWASAARLPVAFVGCFLGVGLIGIGSFFFHATLLWSMQACDELPMIYTTCIFSWGVFQTGQNTRTQKLLPGFIFTFIIVYTYMYFTNKENTLLHQLTYAALQVGSTVRVFLLLSSSPDSALSKKGGRQALVRKEVKRLFYTSIVCFVIAFTAWNIDNIWCQNLRQARKLIGPVFGVLLEGHGWWHILTGYGAYMSAMAGALLVGSIQESPETFKVTYVDRYELLPYLVRVRPADTKNSKRR